MITPQQNPLLAWSMSEEGQNILRQRALENIELIRAMPRCGAKAKSTGLPCQQPGSGRGGRCHYHGGASTAGETWGLRQWSDNPSPVVARRQAAKAKWVERAEAEREARLAAMTPDERARYGKWLSARRPGSKDDRVGTKLLSAIDGAAPRQLSDLSVTELQAMIDALQAEKRAWESHHAMEQRLGVFG
ncbi:hypothetical protein [Devosia marina]|uniref:Uncharacterized protein n=1 Tax=Devosia marina TaxID=2683198 RepID=A0A7X3K2U5_9HYPH|nr:hypothetical protein [Devosia marina]MVS97894.1 hypothetical protein [Devosia marina]